VAFIAIVSLLAASSATTAVQWFAGIGGLTGLAALVAVYLNYRRDKHAAKVEDKSVAITELEKAVPGLGDIIEQWQAVVHQLQDDKDALRHDLDDCRKRLLELERGDSL
jgi:hypothetical protein